jgi:PAS domain S-box-containing protein
MKRLSQIRGDSRQEQLLGLILSSMSELVTYQDKSHRIIWANRAAADSLNLTGEKLTGRFCYEAWHQRKDPCPDCPLDKAMQTGRPQEGEVVTPDGRIWFMRGYPVKSEAGVILGAVEVSREITDRKKAEIALRESEERYRALFDRSLLCVYVHDFSGRFLDANQAALRLLGYTRDEITSLNFASLLSPPQLPMAFRMLDEIIKTGSQRHPAEFRLKRKDGTSVWVETEASVILRQGKFMAIQGIARDISDRKTAESELKASLQEKDALLREVHHRVKNNLQVISSLLDMRSMKADNHKISDLCRDARAKIQTISLIHTHIYQSGKYSRIDMRAYLQDLVTYLSQVYSKKSKPITPTIERADIHLSVTQAIPLAIILNEAISNAFKHAFLKRRRGTISISLQKTSEGGAELRVKDNGIGFPADFNIHRVDSLGLKLVRNLVHDQLKGIIRVESNGGAEIVVGFKILKHEEEPNGQNTGGR